LREPTLAAVMPVGTVGALVRTASQPKRVQSFPVAAACDVLPTNSAIAAAARQAMTKLAATLTA
jgi:hypothetical protein